MKHMSRRIKAVGAPLLALSLAACSAAATPTVTPDDDTPVVTATPETSASIEISPDASFDMSAEPTSSASSDVNGESEEPSIMPDASGEPDGGLDGWPSPEDQEFVFLRDAENQLTGGALLADLGDSTGVTIGVDATGGIDMPLTAHIHAAGCDDPDSQVAYELEPVEAGFSSSQVDVPLDELIGLTHSIGLHEEGADGEHVACAELVATDGT